MVTTRSYLSVVAVVTAATLNAPSATPPTTVRLNNGVVMPLMLWGSGGSTQENSTSTAPAVRDAINAGFLGIDCANHYHNQAGVARGIAMSGVSRDQIWLQTKIEPCGHSIITPLYEGHCFNQVTE